MTTPQKTTEIDDNTIDLATETLTGDIRDFLLDRVKRLGKPWAAMTEDEQSDQIHAAKEAAENLVRNACKIIAAEGRKTIVGNLLQVTQKDNIKAVIEFAKTDEMRHELFDAQGMAVLLVVAGSETFTGEREPAEPTPDQGDLIDNAEKLKNGGKVTRLK